MAAVSLFWNTNMATVTSYENALYMMLSLYRYLNDNKIKVLPAGIFANLTNLELLK